MPIFTNEMIKDHALYKEGKEEGIEQGIEQGQKELRALRQQARKKERELKQQAQKKERELKQQAQKKERELKQQAQKEKQQVQKKEIQAIINLHTKGVDIKIIAESYNISQKRVKEVIINWEKQEGKK